MRSYELSHKISHKSKVSDMPNARWDHEDHIGKTHSMHGVFLSFFSSLSNGSDVHGSQLKPKICAQPIGLYQENPSVTTRALKYWVLMLDILYVKYEPEVLLVSTWSCGCFQNPYIGRQAWHPRCINIMSIVDFIGQSIRATPVIWRSLLLSASGLPTISTILTLKPTIRNRFGQGVVLYRVRADIHLVEPTFQFPRHALSCLHLPILDIDTLNNFEFP